MRIVYTLFFLIAGAVPAVANAEYLSQTAIKDMLALSDATPESAGMKQLRVCRLFGEAKDSAQPNQSSRGEVASARVYHSLKQFKAKYQVTKPQWNWQVVCTAEWQLITPGFIKLVGGEKRLKEVVWANTQSKPTIATKRPANPAEVRVRIDNKIYIIRGENLLVWNDCKPLRFDADAPAIRKKGCQ